MSYVRAFALFWYDFVVGDDWTIAAAIAVTLVGLALIVHNVSGTAPLWWVLPVVVVLSLGYSLRRASLQ